MLIFELGKATILKIRLSANILGLSPWPGVVINNPMPQLLLFSVFDNCRIETIQRYTCCKDYILQKFVNVLIVGALEYGAR